MLKVQYPLEITYQDYPDNYSLACIVYFYGCIHDCYNCHNKKLQDFNNGKKININKLIKKIDNFCKLNRTNKIVLSGGDPLYTRNLETIKYLIIQLSIRGYDICIYTGYSKDYIIGNNITGFRYIKCGKYDINLKQISEKTDSYLRFASSNQELYNDKLQLVSKSGTYYFDKEI